MEEDNIVTLQPTTESASMDKEAVRATLTHLLKCLDEEGGISGLFIVAISKPMEEEKDHMDGDGHVGRGFTHFKLGMALHMVDMVQTTLQRHVIPAALDQATTVVVLSPPDPEQNDDQVKH